ncbi:MAG: hypothetical protein EAZ74_02295 [Alphaproteobacteria bacterium]|nr:MAG: hypothetical protein EAY76_06510 [Alphaproteobacteria bacterium]TAF15168.1 MAG: hypothetical protein EAZ74_02295 [Alphaproteobacteria bacterium]TAF41515.1 MAG: hypothetical protein EAZ66_01210 [Alphaproteobacteria bacterium]TAF77039.1 MAG: hypothetical protein EAZ52_02650 [Alphaproteobacteria bacterium]
MEALHTTHANIPYDGRFILSDPHTGSPLSDALIETTHTRKVHLFVIDHSLKDYQHIHPTPTQEDGVYAFHFTPHSNQPYSVWVEFTRQGNDHADRIKLDLPHASAISFMPTLTPSKNAQMGNIHAQWFDAADAPLQQGTSTEIQIRLTDAQGNPITQLDDIMGAKAHMAGFSADGKHFIHTHPMPTDDVSCLRFHIQPEHAGMSRFFLQIQHDGEEVCLPFTRMIKSLDRHTERSDSPPSLAVMCR